MFVCLFAHPLPKEVQKDRKANLFFPFCAFLCVFLFSFFLEFCVCVGGQRGQSSVMKYAVEKMEAFLRGDEILGWGGREPF